MSKRTKQNKAPHQLVSTAVSPADYQKIMVETDADNAAQALWKIINFWAGEKGITLDGYLGIPYERIAPAYDATPEDARETFLTDWCERLAQPPRYSAITPRMLEGRLRRWLREHS